MSKNLTNFKMWEFLRQRNKAWAVLMVILWMVGLAFSNVATSQNLTRNEVSKNIRNLTDQQRLLDATVSELQGMARIESDSQRLNLVKVDNQNIIYLTVSGDKVALK